MPASFHLRCAGDLKPGQLDLVQVWLKLERSSMWPSDPDARAHAQTAFAIAMARELEDQDADVGQHSSFCVKPC